MLILCSVRGFGELIVSSHFSTEENMQCCQRSVNLGYLGVSGIYHLAWAMLPTCFLKAQAKNKLTGERLWRMFYFLTEAWRFSNHVEDGVKLLCYL